MRHLGIILIVILSVSGCGKLIDIDSQARVPTDAIINAVLRVIKPPPTL